MLAHETGHIAGGHLARIREQLAAASTQAILAMLLGIGAMVAGARSGSANMSNAGMAMMQGPQAAIQNSLFGYIRQQEDQADRAGVKFLTATGQSPKGMSDTFKRLADQTLFSEPRRQSVHAVASAAERTRAGARGHGAAEPLLGQEGPARAAGAPRHDARQALRLHGAAGRARIAAIR